MVRRSPRLLAVSAPFLLFALLAIGFDLAWAGLAFRALAWVFLLGIGLALVVDLIGLSLAEPSRTEVPGHSELELTWRLIWWVTHLALVGVLAAAGQWWVLAICYPLVGAARAMVSVLGTRYRRALHRTTYPGWEHAHRGD